MNDTVSVNRIMRKQSLYASVIRSCKKCGAPGYWHNVPDVNVACFAPEKVTQLGADPVGPVCPNCGEDRDEKEELGEIWKREWKVSLWSLMKDAVREMFKPRKELT